MDGSSNNQIGIMDTFIDDRNTRSPEFPIDLPPAPEEFSLTKTRSMVYRNESSLDPSLVSRPVFPMVPDDIPSSSQVEHSQPLISPSRGKRVSPREEDGDSNDDDFQVVSNRKKKAVTHVTSPPTMVLENSPMIIEVRDAPQNRPINSMTTINGPPIVTDAATRYAITRFPFPPFIIRFNGEKINVDQMKRDLVAHVDNLHKTKLNIIGCRQSKVRCSGIETDLLIHVKEIEAFAILLSKSNWPSTLGGQSFILPSMPSIPPQLSLLVKNVDLRVDLSEWEKELHRLYPEVKRVIRMKNKFGNDINLVKLEFTSAVSRNKLLDGKKLLLNHIAYEVTEYLAPLNVLICSKCCGIGHFRKQCPDQLETCRTCVQQFKDKKLHVCPNQSRCKHCNGDHYSNSNKCPVIKSFRSALTRQMMTRHEPGNLPPTSQVNVNNNVWLNRSLNAHPSHSWGSSNIPTTAQFDEMIHGLAKVNETLNIIVESNKVFSQFMHDKSIHDQSVAAEIKRLKDEADKHDQNLSSLANKFDILDQWTQQQTTMLNRIILPILEDLLIIAAQWNKDKSGRPMDADLRSRLSRYKIQVTNALGGNSK